jgi:hypothetical protein
MAPVMAAIKHVARKSGAAVIAIHHRGKGEGDYRGSSVMRDQTDMMFVLERHQMDPDGRNRRALRCVKCRIAEEPKTRWLSIKHHRGELALYEAAPFEPGEAARPVRDELEQQILGIVADKGPITRGNVAKELGREQRDATVRRAMKELLEDGTLLKLADHRYVAAGTEGVNQPLTPSDPQDTLDLGGGCHPLKGNDTLTPSEDPA